MIGALHPCTLSLSPRHTRPRSHTHSPKRPRKQKRGPRTNRHSRAGTWTARAADVSPFARPRETYALMSTRQCCFQYPPLLSPTCHHAAFRRPSLCLPEQRQRRRRHSSAVLARTTTTTPPLAVLTRTTATTPPGPLSLHRATTPHPGQQQYRHRHRSAAPRPCNPAGTVPCPVSRRGPEYAAVNACGTGLNGGSTANGTGGTGTGSGRRSTGRMGRHCAGNRNGNGGAR